MVDRVRNRSFVGESEEGWVFFEKILLSVAISLLRSRSETCLNLGSSSISGLTRLIGSNTMGVSYLLTDLTGVYGFSRYFCSLGSSTISFFGSDSICLTTYPDS